jgi:streptomycin 6-kinase
MLLERCEPGSTLRARPEEEQDEVIARLLRRIWRIPPDPHPFRPLAEMTAHWIAEAMEDNPDSWPDAGLVREGLRIFEELPRTASRSVLLATDLHAGNVRAARREPWLIIDPKPFFGEPAYDATQHLMNCERRMRASPVDTVNRFADLLELDRERVKLWAFARCAFDSRDDDAHTLAIARMLRPD